MGSETVILVCAIVLVVMSFIIWACSRYKKCPSDKIMVVYGSIGKNKDGTNRSAKCIHGGAEFVIPVFQSYAFLDLTPISIQVDLKNALSRQNEIEYECDNEGADQSTKFAIQLGSAQAYLQMLNDVLTVYEEEFEKEEAAYEKSVLGEEV